jgi:hypothetical protein
MIAVASKMLEDLKLMGPNTGLILQYIQSSYPEASRQVVAISLKNKIKSVYGVRYFIE